MSSEASSASRPAAKKPAVAAPRHGRSWIWRYLALSIVILLIVGGVIYWATRGEEAPPYVTTPAQTGNVTRAVTATGTVNPVLTIIVGSYVSGVIQEVTCDFNTKVTKGQICANIDPRPYQTLVDQEKANIDNSKAQLEKDKANLVYAKLTADRYALLVKQDSASQDAADSAKNTYEQALAQVDLDNASIEQHEAALEGDEVNLEYTDIISPVDGTVVSRNVTIGQTVAATLQTPTLFLIATDLTNMQVDTNVSESDIGAIKVGDSATFTVEAFQDRSFTGKVVQVRQAPQTVQNVVTYDVIIGVANPDLALAPGMTATTRIVTDERDNVLRVPDQALRFLPRGVAAPSGGAGGSRVWVLRNGQAIAVPVTLGLDDDTNSEVTGGNLKAGDQVIVGEEHAASAQSAGTRLFGFL